MPNLLRRQNEGLVQVLDYRRKLDAELRPTRVQSRNDDGTLQMRPLTGECVARAPVCGLYPGQVVEMPCAAPFRMSGAAGIPMVRNRRELATLRVTLLEPALLTRGFFGTVIVTGIGIGPTFDMDYLVPETETINPAVTILEIRVNSATEAEVDVTVAEDAEVVPEGTGDIAYENVGMPL